MSALRTLRLAVLVPLARLRFLFVLGAIGLVLVKWDEIVARYERYTGHADSGVSDPDHEFFCPMEALTADRGDEDPDMRAMMSRASASANFMRLP